MTAKFIKFGIAFMAIFAVLSLISCQKDNNPTPNPDPKPAPTPNPTPNPTATIVPATNLPELTVTIKGAITIGKAVDENAETFSFNRFPNSVDEFKTVREKVGSAIGGGVLLQIMAMEMYSHNKPIGEACIRLCVTKTYQNMVIDGFKRVFYEYKKPYAAASLLAGANPREGNNPTEPYAITVKVDEVLMKDAEKEAGGTYSSIFDAYVLYLKVDNFRRLKGNGEMSKAYSQFAVVKTAKKDEPSENKYYVVQSSGDILVDPEPISLSSTYNGVAPFKK